MTLKKFLIISLSFKFRIFYLCAITLVLLLSFVCQDSELVKRPRDHSETNVFAGRENMWRNIVNT